MKLKERMVLKEIVSCNNAKILVTAEDIYWELGYDKLDETLETLEWQGYLVKVNNCYKATGKTLEYFSHS